jgi:hypothetical protein
MNDQNMSPFRAGRVEIYPAQIRALTFRHIIEYTAIEIDFRKIFHFARRVALICCVPMLYVVS